MADKNPYPPGSARAQLWDRENNRGKTGKGRKKAPPNSDRSNRRKQLDNAIEQQTAARVSRMRMGQFSDENNYG